MKIRLEGTETECEAAVRRIEQVMLVGRISEPQPKRSGRDVLVYLDDVTIPDDRWEAERELFGDPEDRAHWDSPNIHRGSRDPLRSLPPSPGVRPLLPGVRPLPPGVRPRRPPDPRN